MEKLGFSSLWISWIMECITIVFHSVLINGEPHKFIQPSRGLRQGDNLSPYLFILCAQGFSNLLRQAVQKGKTFKGSKLLDIA